MAVNPVLKDWICPFPDSECNFLNVPSTLGPTLLYYFFICFSIKTLEEIKDHWDNFAGAFETFSLWISDKEKQLDGLKSSTLPLEQQINTVKVPCVCCSTTIYCSIQL